MAGKVRNLLFREGRFYARLVVPKELRPILKKTEFRTPLGADRRAAMNALPHAIIAIREKISAAALDSGSAIPNFKPLSLEEIARLHYKEELEYNQRIRSYPRLSGESTPEKLDHIFGGELRERSLLKSVSWHPDDDEELNANTRHTFDHFVHRGLIKPDCTKDEWREIVNTIARAELEALQRAFELNRKNYDGEPKFAPLKEKFNDNLVEKGEPLMGLLDRYCDELALSGKGKEARKRWRPCFKALIAFLGHDNGKLISRKDILSWREHLLLSLAPKTIRDVYLAGLKAVLKWSVEVDRLSINAAQNITVKAQRPKQNREKGVNDDEARAILSACLKYSPIRRANNNTNEQAGLVSAKRWVPWLCAHTGARVAEITQLRKEDVRLDHPVPHIRITPDAGSVKNDRYRDVPIHPELLSIGFAGFVSNSADGPLFYIPTERKPNAQAPSKQVAGRVGAWVRSLNILPPEVDPNHGWRHRLKSVARDLDLNPRVIDAVQGHAARTAGEAYGSVSLEAKALAIGKIPTILALRDAL